MYMHLGNQSRGGLGHVLPGGGENGLGLVIARQAVDTRLNQNETKLGVSIVAVLLQMAAHAHSLLDQMVQIFGQFRGNT
jgi:hypothetical protein